MQHAFWHIVMAAKQRSGSSSGGDEKLWRIGIVNNGSMCKRAASNM